MNKVKYVNGFRNFLFYFNYIILIIIGILCYVIINCINYGIWNFFFLFLSILEEICVYFILFLIVNVYY